MTTSEIESSLSRISDFSSSLTGVLHSLEKGCKTLKVQCDGNRQATQQLTVDVAQHTQLIEELMASKDELMSNVEEALSAHAHMGKTVMHVMSTSTGDLQKELMSLRLSTKSELTALQGSLSLLITQAMGQLAKSTSTASKTKLPPITADTAPSEVINILVERIEALERKSEIQESTNTVLMNALTSEKNIHDKFDLLTCQFADMEAMIDSQAQQNQNLEACFKKLSVGQAKLEHGLKELERKIMTLAKDQGKRFSTTTINFGAPSIAAASQAAVENLQKEAAKMDDFVEETETNLEYGENVPEEAKDAVQEEAPVTMVPTSSYYSRPTSHKSLPSRPSSRPSSRRSIRGNENSPIEVPVMDPALLVKIEKLDKLLHEDVVVRLDELWEKQESQLSKIVALDNTVKELDATVETKLLSHGDPHAALLTLAPQTTDAANKEFHVLLLELKDKWNNVAENLESKILVLNQHMLMLESQPTEYQKRLGNFKLEVAKALQEIEERLGQNKTTVLDALYNKIDALSYEAEQLADIERNAEKKDREFSEALSQASHRSSRFLDEKIDKTSLKRRIDAIEQELLDKVNMFTVNELDKDLRVALSMKADHKAVDLLNQKKASNVDLQNLREMVLEQIDSLMSMHLAANSKQILHSSKATADDGGRYANEKLDDLNQRFEMLYRQFQDTLNRINSFAPREEVESALQSVLDEMRSVKVNYVDKVLLQEKLSRKANAGELEKLLQLLSGSIGDVSGTAAAIHKCLVCDKPVNPFSLLPDSPTRGNQTYGYDKVAEFNRNRPATSGAVLSSTRPSGDVRISAEVNILRNSVEVLPMIATAENAGQAVSRDQVRSREQHKKRIRASAGGGLGPTYAQDTR